jgi:hypothetical protein
MHLILKDMLIKKIVFGFTEEYHLLGYDAV